MAVGNEQPSRNAYVECSLPKEERGDFGLYTGANRLSDAFLNVAGRSPRVRFNGLRNIGAPIAAFQRHGKGSQAR